MAKITQEMEDVVVRCFYCKSQNRFNSHKITNATKEEFGVECTSCGNMWSQENPAFTRKRKEDKN